jgi:hypothetical protein
MLEPRYDLPSPATNLELIAAAMMTEGHRGAADLNVGLGMHLTNALYWLREPDGRLQQRLAEGGPGDPWAPGIAGRMLEAGRAEAQRLGCSSAEVDTALSKLEAMPCPCCGREFRGE